MFRRLSQRIHGSERQTRELSIQSERQMRTIQKISDSHNEALTKLLSRMEQQEKAMVGLENVTESLTLDQRQLNKDQQDLAMSQQKNEHKIRALEAEFEALKKQVQVLRKQQQGRRTRPMRNVSDL